MSELPSDDECEKVTDNGETLYVCDGVIYRSTYYKDEQVYEIASDAPEEIDAGPTTVFGLSLTDPMTQGDVVRDMQQRLVDRGYDVGSVDGVFGSSTEAALQWLQYDNELDVTGVVDAETAKLLGYEQQPLEDAEAPPAAVPEATDTPEGGAVNQPLQD